MATPPQATCMKTVSGRIRLGVYEKMVREARDRGISIAQVINERLEREPETTS